MPIISANSTYETMQPQKRVRVLNPTARTLPKAGKNGTGSQFSGSLDAIVTHVPTKSGNAFGHNGYGRRTSATSDEKSFSQVGNNAIATGRAIAPPYTSTSFAHPNAHFMDVARSVKRPPAQQGSPNGNDSQPAGTFKQQSNPASSAMPHERNGIGANQGRNLSKRAIYRSAAGGTNKLLPSDTAFHKLATKREPSLVQVMGNAPQPPDNSSRPSGHATGKVSWSSRNNLWYDPNNSFIAGAPQTANDRTGAGRWQIIKRGAAG